MRDPVTFIPSTLNTTSFVSRLDPKLLSGGGQIQFTKAGSFAFTVPAGVYSVSAVVLGGGGGGHMNASTSGGSSSIFRSNSTLLLASGGNNSTGGLYQSYYANSDQPSNRQYEGAGGIGLIGQVLRAGGDGGQNGPAGYAAGYRANGLSSSINNTSDQAFYTFSGGYGTDLFGHDWINPPTFTVVGGFGGGGGGPQKLSSYNGGGRLGGGGGGGLAYSNNIQVTPGEILGIIVGAPGGGYTDGSGGGAGGTGGVRIIWGGSRSFPDTAFSSGIDMTDGVGLITVLSDVNLTSYTSNVTGVFQIECIGGGGSGSGDDAGSYNTDGGGGGGYGLLNRYNIIAGKTIQIAIGNSSGTTFFSDTSTVAGYGGSNGSAGGGRAGSGGSGVGDITFNGASGGADSGSGQSTYGGPAGGPSWSPLKGAGGYSYGLGSLYGGGGGARAGNGNSGSGTGYAGAQGAIRLLRIA